MCCPVHENEPPRGRYVQQSQSKNSCLAGKQTYHHINKIYQIRFFPQTKLNFTSRFRIFGILDLFCHTAGKFYYICKRLSKTAQYSWVDINFRQLFCPCLSIQMLLIPKFIVVCSWGNYVFISRKYNDTLRHFKILKYCIISDMNCNKLPELNPSFIH